MTSILHAKNKRRGGVGVGGGGPIEQCNNNTEKIDTS
jgi:hypothetical protein